jgi:mono/diheme cytochrome c family protein
MRIAAILALGAIGAACVSAAPPPKAPETRLKSPVPPSGANLYRSYCASCHGEDGKGGGPVADSLRMRPSDLTTLSKRNGGKFPAFRLQKMVDGSDELPAHGTRRMPVWGPGLGVERARALIEHLEKIQK